MNDSKAFIEYSNNMDDIRKYIEEYNSNKKWKILILFDDMIADMLSNKKLNSIVTEWFIRARKLNILHNLMLLFENNVRLNSTHHFVIKITYKRGFKHTAFNNSSDIDFQDFWNLCKRCTAKPYSYLVIDITLLSDNLSNMSILQVQK